MSEKTVANKAAPKVRKDITKWQWIRRQMVVNRVGYLLVAPYFLVFLTFTVAPVILSLFLSFTSFNMLELPKFLFMDNYVRLFLDDDIFLIAIKNTFVFAVITGPVSYLLCLMFAWFINELTPKVRSIVTLIYYAPSISGQVYLIWQVLFSSDSYGYANGILMKLGVINTPILWFQDTEYIMPLVIMVALWTSLGTSFLSFIAGFQVVDKSLYEAAAVDGIRNRWQELWFVTLPVMKNQMMFAAIMSITGSFGFGGVVTALCGFPSVDYAAHTIMHHLEDYGGQRFEVGYSSAIATILFFMMIGANALIKKLLSKVGQ